MYPIHNRFSLILHGQKERGKNRTCTLHSLLLDHTFSLVLIFTRFSHTSLFNSQLTNHHSTQVHWPTISIFPALITCSKTICSFNFQASEDFYFIDLVISFQAFGDLFSHLDDLYLRAFDDLFMVLCCFNFNALVTCVVVNLWHWIRFRCFWWISI